MSFRLTAALGVLGELHVGVIVIGESGRVLLMNRKARSIVERGDALNVIRNHLLTNRADSTEQLRSLIRDAVGGTREHASRSVGVMMLAKNPSGPALGALITPLQFKQFEGVNDRAAAMILIADPDAIIEPSFSVLRRQFGLTRAESRVAECLMRGETIEQAAKSLKISSATVRTHLKRIFAKTATRRQPELVHLLLRGWDADGPAPTRRT